MATIEAFKRIQAPLIAISKFLGAEVWTSDKRFQPASYVLMTHMVIYNVCNGYTVVRYKSDPVQLMKITIVFGIATQLIFKFFLALFEKQSLRNLFVVIEENIYSRYSGGTKEEKAIVEKTTRYLGIIWKAMSLLYMSTLFMFALWPVYVYYSEHRLIPLFMYEIPTVDSETTIGYVLTLLFHVDIYVLGLLGSIMADYLFVFISLQALTSIDLFILHLSNLKELLTADVAEKDTGAIAERWKKCMKDHQFLTELLNDIEDFTSLLCLVQVFSCVFTICDAMLLVSVTDWYAAFCFLLVVFGEITIYFLLGNAVELKIDAMYGAITALPWNLLNVSQQNEYRYLLARTQRPLKLTVYGFAPLNFESYMSVLKILYQFFVLVLRFIK